MDDLINEFITETMESLSILDLELVKLEQNPRDTETLSNIFRQVHTIKGTCGFLGLPRLEGVAHASENVLGKIREGKLEATPQAISSVLASLDSIKALVDHLSRHGQEAEGDDTALISRLNHFADTGMDGEEHSAAADEKPPEDLSNNFKGDDDLEALMADQQAEEPAATVPLPTLTTNNAPAADKPLSPEKNDGVAAQSIRVNIDVLETLMQMVSELVLTRNQLMQVARMRDDKDFLSPIQQLSHITSELQEGIMKTRMQPIGNAWSKFPRLVRDLSLELGKKIDLQMIGAETELDRQLLEMIKDPLTHMVRNSCDHGLEASATRKAAGKSETGTVKLSAYHEGGHIVIDIADDGKGLDVARIKEKAIANNIVTVAECASLSDQQIMQFIFRPGFSTAEKVTAVSGRGVGMDVVRTNIEKIGGTIDLTSALGKGSKFSIKIPLTLAIVSVLIVEASSEKMAIPQINVVELVRVTPGSEFAIETINGAPVMRLREKLLPLRTLSDILQLPSAASSKEEAFVVVCSAGGCDFGLIVDRVYDTEEIVVKPVAQGLKSIPVYSGNTILGDGSVIMILDPNGIARSVSEVDLGSPQQAGEVGKALLAGDHIVGFLLFMADKGAPKAVPLELVSRLEEIDVQTIELAGDQPVVQYRGDLMPLITVGNTELPATGKIPVIVFTYDMRTLGLAVEKIIDIVEAPFSVKAASTQKGFLGSVVLAGKATDVVDAGELLSRMVGMVDMSDVDVQTAKQCRLLLAEDSPFFRNLTVPFLSAVGYQVTAVENGAEALNLLARKPGHYHALVSDIEMPVMNGYELARSIRNHPALSGLPIIAYTAAVNQEVIDKTKAADIDACIIKTDRPSLLRAIANSLADTGKLAA